MEAWQEAWGWGWAGAADGVMDAGIRRLAACLLEAVDKDSSWWLAVDGLIGR